MRIGKLIKSKREMLGLTQVMLAYEAGVSLPTIQNIEAEKANPTLNVFEKLGAKLGIKLDFISRQPDWAFLSQYGLAVLAFGQSKSALNFTHRTFADQIILAINSTKINKETRLTEGVAALIIAIHKNFPTYYTYFLESSLSEALIKKFSRHGRVIKLTRLSLEKISRYL